MKTFEQFRDEYVQQMAGQHALFGRDMLAAWKAGQQAVLDGFDRVLHVTLEFEGYPEAAQHFYGPEGAGIAAARLMNSPRPDISMHVEVLYRKKKPGDTEA